MKTLRSFLAVIPPLALAGPAWAHETGVPHESGPFHPILGIDHLLILLGVVVIAGIVAFLRR